MNKFRKVIALMLALAVTIITATGNASAAITTCDNSEGETQVAELPNTENGIMPLRTTKHYTVGGYDEEGKERGPINIYSASKLSPLSGAVTINVLNFNPVLYQLDIWVYDKHGLLWREDNWTKLGSSNAFTAVNVTAIDARIKPRASLFTDPKAFTVEIIY